MAPRGQATERSNSAGCASVRRDPRVERAPLGSVVELLAERVARLVGAEPVGWEERAAPWQPRGAVEGGNERFSVLLADGRRVFVKAARGELTAVWLRREYDVYAHLRGTFIPKLEAFDDDPLYPVLVLEDLSDAEWEIRWELDRILLVRSALSQMRLAWHRQRP